MAKMQIRGLSEYSKQLNQLYDDADEIIKRSLYDGMAVMKSAIESAIDTIPTRTKGFAKPGEVLTGITNPQKKGLKESFGITPMKEDGSVWNVKCGFDGYNNVKTDKFPNGQPNQLIARSINSGTSWLQATHFVDKAVRANKEACMQAMSDTCDDEIKQRTGGIEE